MMMMFLRIKQLLDRHDALSESLGISDTMELAQIAS